VCTALVTEDGASIPAVKGQIRAGAPLKFPTRTRPASSYLPSLDQYVGLPLDYGRMETTISDSTVRQQFGMVTGIPNAGQVNALESINLRGERSVSCKAGCDAHPSTGKLPASCPAACETFRKMPDALERASELDAQYGRNPDLEKLPMYCLTVSVKDWYDVKDMRSTGGNDVKYAMDAGPADSTIVAALRNKGAIIYAVSIAAEVNHRADAGPLVRRGRRQHPQQLGRARLQSVRHGTLSGAFERRCRRFGERQSRELRYLRDDRRLVQGACESECRAQSRHDEGAHFGGPERDGAVH
jgi:hypothetical protein